MSSANAVQGARFRQSSAPDIHRTLISGTVQVREALDDVQEKMGRVKIEGDLRDTAQIILGEVLNNVVEHAYGFDEGHPIDLSIWARDDGLWCIVRDEGVAMPNGVPPAGIMPLIDGTAVEDLPEGGFGWAMVRELTEGIQYDRSEGVNLLQFLIPKL